MNLAIILQVVVIAYIGYYVHVIGKQYYMSRAEKGKTTTKVFDIGHKYIPSIYNSYYPHIINTLVLIPVLYMWIMGYNTSTVQFFKLILTLYFLRAITTIATILPKDKQCNDKEYTLYNMFDGHCYDKIFSGHFGVVCVALLILYYNHGISIYFLAPYAVLVAYLIIATRSHYTVDILISAFVSYSIFKLNIGN